jgi:ABC-type Fe3+ transport system permease subunit
VSLQHGQPYTEASQATTILVLGILSLVVCGVLGPVAWAMGNNEVAAIDAGRRPPENRGTANAGRILGIIATVFLILGVLVVIAIIAIAIAAGSDTIDTDISDIFDSTLGALAPLR